MTCLHTSCPGCGRLLTAPAAALLLDEATSTAWLICPSCADLVARPMAGPRSADLFASLTQHGAHVVQSAVARHPEGRPGGPALSADDVLDLHQSLSDDDAVAGAVSALTAERPA
jgi:hypothetical protein